MKDYIVTVEESYFDATKFEIGGFYLVKYKSTLTDEDVETYKCILTSATKRTLTFIYYNYRGCKTELQIAPHSIESGRYDIEKFSGNDNLKDLYNNKDEIKVGKCYKLKIGEYIYNGFCSKRDDNTITMVLFSDNCELGVVYRDITIRNYYNDTVKFIHFPGDAHVEENSVTNGTVATINLNEIKENSVLFREMV